MKADEVKAINGVLEALDKVIGSTTPIADTAWLEGRIDVYRAAGSPVVPNAMEGPEKRECYPPATAGGQAVEVVRHQVGDAKVSEYRSVDASECPKTQGDVAGLERQVANWKSAAAFCCAFVDEGISEDGVTPADLQRCWALIESVRSAPVDVPSAEALERAIAVLCDRKDKQDKFVPTDNNTLGPKLGKVISYLRKVTP